jgi:hypothetical protein
MTTKVKVFLNFLIRITVLVLSLYFLYVQFYKKIPPGELLAFAKEMVGSGNFLILTTCTFLLMAVNWWLEIYKWKIITSSFTEVPFRHCFKGVVSGITISMFLPNRIGDVAGKLLWLSSYDRWKGFFANFYASLAQITATILISSLSLIYLRNILHEMSVLQFSATGISIVSAALLVLFLFVYFHLGFVATILSDIKLKYFRKISDNIHVLDSFSQKKRIYILALSVLRFFIYSFQFYLMLLAFGLNIGVADAMMLIAVVYLFITIVPQFAIAEIATRGALAIIVFDAYINSGGILSAHFESALLLAATSLWFINLFIPAMIGLSVLPGVRIHKTER